MSANAAGLPDQEADNHQHQQPQRSAPQSRRDSILLSPIKSIISRFRSRSIDAAEPPHHHQTPAAAAAVVPGLAHEVSAVAAGVSGARCKAVPLPDDKAASDKAEAADKAKAGKSVGKVAAQHDHEEQDQGGVKFRVVLGDEDVEQGPYQLVPAQAGLIQHLQQQPLGHNRKSVVSRRGRKGMTSPEAAAAFLDQDLVILRTKDKTISVKIQGGSSLQLLGSPRRGFRRNDRSPPPGHLAGNKAGLLQRRHPTSVERENQERIDRENRILLRKILEQHHGLRRNSVIPPAPRSNALSPCTGRKGCHHHLHHHSFAAANAESRDQKLRRLRNRPTSNQLNQQRLKHKTDYENLLLLQKIQNARPSRAIESSFARLKI